MPDCNNRMMWLLLSFLCGFVIVFVLFQPHKRTFWAGKISIIQIVFLYNSQRNGRQRKRATDLHFVESATKSYIKGALVNKL